MVSEQTKLAARNYTSPKANEIRLNIKSIEQSILNNVKSQNSIYLDDRGVLKSDLNQDEEYKLELLSSNVHTYELCLNISKNWLEDAEKEELMVRTELCAAIGINPDDPDLYRENILDPYEVDQASA